MYDESIEWLIYSPPKSVSFGHQSRPRNARKAWNATKSFLEKFTQHNFGHLRTLTCWCYILDEPLELAVKQERVEAARGQFGPETGRSLRRSSWDLLESSIESAVEFALEDDKFPKMTNGPTDLHFHYRFLWSNFLGSSAGRGNLSGFDGSQNCFSDLGVVIGGQRVFLQPRFIFPGSWQSPQIRFFLDEIELTAPFRFRDQYFRRSLPSSKTGKQRGGKVYNLAKGWRFQISN